MSMMKNVAKFGLAVSLIVTIAACSGSGIGGHVSTFGGIVAPIDVRGLGDVGSLHNPARGSLSSPTGVATDGVNVYVADTANNLIRQIVISTGMLTTLAGSGTAGSADGTGTAASFNYPYGLSTDGVNVYVADTANNLIRQIVISTGVVTTLAGSGTAGAANGIGSAASFNHPCGIAGDANNLYIADTANNLIRQIVKSTGVVTTLAGTGKLGNVNGPAASASFNDPSGIATDGTNLYIADRNNFQIRQIVLSTGAVSVLAGSGTPGAADGPGTAASFAFPAQVASDGKNVYVADSGNNLIRQIVVGSGVVTTLAGSGAEGKDNGTGAGATFNRPAGIAVGTSKGSVVQLYVADSNNNLVRAIQ